MFLNILDVQDGPHGKKNHAAPRFNSAAVERAQCSAERQPVLQDMGSGRFCGCPAHER